MRIPRVVRDVSILLGLVVLGGLPIALGIHGFGVDRAASVSEPQWRFPSDNITREQWQEYRAEVLAKPRLQRQEFANQLVLISREEGRIYVFTQPQHPAYPAVVIRAVIPRETGAEVRRMGHYAGDKDAFDKWWHKFDALDARIPGPVPLDGELPRGI